jgi:hypothetical protein
MTAQLLERSRTVRRLLLRVGSHGIALCPEKSELERIVRLLHEIDPAPPHPSCFIIPSLPHIHCKNHHSSNYRMVQRRTSWECNMGRVLWSKAIKKNELTSLKIVLLISFTNRHSEQMGWFVILTEIPSHIRVPKGEWMDSQIRIWIEK